VPNVHVNEIFRISRVLLLSRKMVFDSANKLKLLTLPSQRQILEASTSETEEDSNNHPSSEHRESMVHDAVSRVVSDIMPSGMDTMTTLNDTYKSHGKYACVVSKVVLFV